MYIPVIKRYVHHGLLSEAIKGAALMCIPARRFSSPEAGGEENIPSSPLLMIPSSPLPRSPDVYPGPQVLLAAYLALLHTAAYGVCF